MLVRKTKLTPRRPKMGQDRTKMAQDGPKLAQDRAKMGQDGRKMAQDTENELQGAAQDRQDAISEGCPERLIKTNPVQGPWRASGGSVKGQSRVRGGSGPAGCAALL